MQALRITQTSLCPPPLRSARRLGGTLLCISDQSCSFVSWVLNEIEQSWQVKNQRNKSNLAKSNFFFSISAPFDNYQLFFTLLDQVLFKGNHGQLNQHFFTRARNRISSISHLTPPQNQNQYLAARIKNSKVSTKTSAFYLFFVDGAAQATLLQGKA